MLTAEPRNKIFQFDTFTKTIYNALVSSGLFDNPINLDTIRKVNMSSIFFGD